jgi:predicted transcriptional regulator
MAIKKTPDRQMPEQGGRALTTMRLSKKLIKALDAIAKSRGQSRSLVTESALVDFVNRNARSKKPARAEEEIFS